MRIGSPKEIKNHEYRVGLTPESVKELVMQGHEVWIETEAGCGIDATDEQYVAAGAKIVDGPDPIFAECEMVVKVKEPQAVERAMLRPGQILYTYLHLAPDPDQTRELMNDGAFNAMKKSAYLVNVARGGCVNEPALLSALARKTIAGAAIDHFNDEPLPVSSPFWALDNLIITPHTGGETRKYEENVIDILWQNLQRLWNNQSDLVNQVI